MTEIRNDIAKWLHAQPYAYVLLLSAKYFDGTLQTSNAVCREIINSMKLDGLLDYTVYVLEAREAIGQSLPMPASKYRALERERNDLFRSLHEIEQIALTDEGLLSRIREIAHNAMTAIVEETK